MKFYVPMAACCLLCLSVYAQSSSTELYDLIKKLLPDSTGYENVGDWAVGNAKKYPVKWKADKIEMSNDTSINFYRTGEAAITLRSKTFNQQDGQPLRWNVMLKGPRMGFGSFSIISGNSPSLSPKYTIDSLFGNKPYQYKLKKSCDSKELSGFYYYELKLSKKEVVFMKVGWLCINGTTALRIDVYDNYSQYAAKLHCAN